MVTGQSPGKTQPRDDLESEDLPVPRSPLLPASDREEIHIPAVLSCLSYASASLGRGFFISRAGGYVRRGGKHEILARTHVHFFTEY